MERKVILIDVDDVICEEHYFPSVNEYLAKTGRPIIRSLDEFDMIHYIEHVFKGDDYTDFMKFFLSDNVYRGAKPIKGAVEAVKHLNEHHSVYLVTATKRKREHAREFVDKFNWLLDNLPFIDPNRIVMINEKHLLKGDVIIDDRIYNLKGDFKTKILFPARQNKKITKAELDEVGAIMVTGWDEILKILS